MTGGLDAPRGIGWGIVFSIPLWAIILLLATNAHCQTLLVIGHSFAQQQCWHRQDFPGWNMVCIGHPGETTAQILADWPTDAAMLQDRSIKPDVILVWMGTNDAERRVLGPSWARDAWSYYTTLKSTYPNARIIWPNICPLGQVTQLLYGDTRPWVMSYNRSIFWSRPLDVWSLTKGLGNWSNMTLIPSIHPDNAGWRVIDAAILEALK